MYRIVLSSLAAMAAFTIAAARADAVPTQVSFAGRLADASGPIDGEADLTFRLYEGANIVWEEEHASVDAEAGLVFVSLGSVDPLDASVFTGASLLLEIDVDGETLSPRLPIAAVPYAGRAGVADDAERFGGELPDAYASADHTHAGVYLPIGGTPACTPPLKVTGLSSTGDVQCGVDIDTTYTAGGGLSLAAGAFSIANLGVTTARLADDAVTAAKLADDAVGTAQVAADSLTAADLAANACAASEMADNAVGNAEMLDNAIGNAEMADNAIALAEMADNAIGNAEMRDDAIGNAEMASNAIGSAEIIDGAITRSDISGTEVSLYLYPAGCQPTNDTGYGSRVVASTSAPADCPQTPCGGGMWLACSSGSCNDTTPSTCAFNRVGYLLADN